MKTLSKRVICAVMAVLLVFSMVPGIGRDRVYATEDGTAAIGVKKVEFGNVAYDDFIRGVDISTYDALWNSGVRYYDYDGNELTEYGDFFTLLKESGVNWVRLRVWNDPFNDEDKTEGYGAGNVDVACATRMGKAATDAGLRVLVDFHYSDFWADPGKSRAPKAWQKYFGGDTEGNPTVDVKGLATELAEFTKGSLTSMIGGGVDVGMVQVGNETNNAICGVYDWDDMCTLFKAGCDAVKEVAKAKDKEILTALHFASPHEYYGEEDGDLADQNKLVVWAQTLEDNGVDYDVFASSYYAFWHGSLENLNKVLSEIADTYGKKVMVAETSWAYTFDDADDNGNVIYDGVDNEWTTTEVYEISAQGQADSLRDVIDTIAHTSNGIGVFYWEPAWIPTYTSAGDADTYTNYDEEALEKNKALWEKYGTGWSSTHLGEYADEGEWIDPDEPISGSEWDNQALFTFDGKPLPSLKTFAYVKEGVRPEQPTGYDFLNIYINGEGELELWYDKGDVDWDSFNSTFDSYWKIKKIEGGSCLIAGTESDYDIMYSYDDGPVLTLDNVEFQSVAEDQGVIWSDVPLTIEVKGTNKLTHTMNRLIGVCGGLTITGNGTLELVTTAGEKEDEDGGTYIPSALEMFDICEEDEDGNSINVIEECGLTVGENVTLSCSSKNEWATVYAQCGIGDVSGNIVLPEGQGMVLEDIGGEDRNLVAITNAVSLGSGNYEFSTDYYLDDDVIIYAQIVDWDEESGDLTPISANFGSGKSYAILQNGSEDNLDESLGAEEPYVIKMSLSSGTSLTDNRRVVIGTADLSSDKMRALYFFKDGKAQMLGMQEEDGWLGGLLEEPGTCFAATVDVADFDELEIAYWKAQSAFVKALDAYYGNGDSDGAKKAYEDAKEAGKDMEEILGLYQAANDAYDKVDSSKKKLKESYDALAAVYGDYGALAKQMVQEKFDDVKDDYEELSTVECEAPDKLNVPTEEGSIEVEPEKGAPAVAVKESVADILASIELTDAEKASILNGDAVTITVSEAVIETPSADEKTKIDAKLDGYTAGIYLDYTVELAIGTATRTVAELDAPITITVNVPAELLNTDATKDRSYRIVTVHEGVASVIEGTFDQTKKTFTFKAKEFSTYLLAYKDTAKTTPETPGDGKEPSDGGAGTPGTGGALPTSPGTGGAADLTSFGGVFALGLLMLEGMLLIGYVKVRRRRW